MIEIEDVTNKYSDEVAQLVYESMMCPFTSSRIYDDLTFEEVRDEILVDNPISVIKKDGVIIGVCNPNPLHKDMYNRLELDSNDKYVRLGILYIAEEYRGKGYAKETLKKFIEMNKDKKVIYITHQTNEVSNAVALSVMPLIKDYLNFFNWKRYNIYIK